MKTATLVIGEKFGRLGNRLWLFSHVLAHAIERGLQVKNPCFDDYADSFRIGQGDLLCSYPVQKSWWRHSARTRHLSYTIFSKALFRLRSRTKGPGFEIVRTGMNDVYDLEGSDFAEVVSRNRYVVLAGWRFRSYASFDKHAGPIRELLRPVQEIETKVRRVVERARDGADVLIGLHMRQSDYQQFLKGAYYFTTEEYIDIIRRVQPLFPARAVRFLICADEPQDETRFSDFDHSWGSGDAVEDLFSLASCDYVLGPPSTFTMWASFYGSVPLYKIMRLSEPISLDSFQIVDGRFDVEADAV
jgi:hypothetical protein